MHYIGLIGTVSRILQNKQHGLQCWQPYRSDMIGLALEAVAS